MKTKTVQKNIPNRWQENKLLDCFRVPSKLAGIKLSEYQKDGEFPVFDQAQDYISGFSSNKDLVVKDVPAILFGDHTRIVKYIKSPFVVGADGTKIFWAKDNFDPTFLYYLVLNQKIPNTGYNRHFKFFKDIKVVLPESKTEQKKIAEILGAMDEDIMKTQEVIETTQKLKRGLMKQLFTRGIGHTKFKETIIGEMPESWCVVQVSEVVKKIVDNRGKTPLLSSDGIGMIEVNSIDSSEKYPNYSKISKYVSQEIYDSWFRSGHPEKGDILIPTVGTVGVAVIMKESKGCIAQNIIAVRVKDTILPDFFYYLVISSLFVGQIRKVLMGAVQPSLKVPHMLSFHIPMPALPEQKQIAEILSSVDEKISVNKKLKEKLTVLKKGLMQDLLSGNVRTNI